jgi:hypothetical protein
MCDNRTQTQIRQAIRDRLLAYVAQHKATPAYLNFSEQNVWEALLDVGLVRTGDGKAVLTEAGLLVHELGASNCLSLIE